MSLNENLRGTVMRDWIGLERTEYPQIRPINQLCIPFT